METLYVCSSVRILSVFFSQEQVQYGSIYAASGTYCKCDGPKSNARDGRRKEGRVRLKNTHMKMVPTYVHKYTKKDLDK